jgi:hypothetical protein
LSVIRRPAPSCGPPSGFSQAPRVARRSFRASI